MTSPAFVPPEDLLGDPDEYIEDGEDVEYDEEVVDEDDAELTDDDDSDVVELDEDLPGFDLQWEDRPVKPTRTYKKKILLPWEEWLAILTRPENVGRTIRVFRFSGEDAKKHASARARSIRAHLIKHQPELVYEITVDELDSEIPVWGVYASYSGEADEDLLAHRMEVKLSRQEHGRRVAAARMASQSAPVSS